MKICKDRLQISFILLSQFENFNFNFPWNHWKTIGFLVISGEVEVINSLNNRREIGDDPLDQKVMVERYRLYSVILALHRKSPICYVQKIFTLCNELDYHKVKNVNVKSFVRFLPRKRTIPPKYDLWTLIFLQILLIIETIGECLFLK